jgi:hypothetical protein
VKIAENLSSFPASRMIIFRIYDFLSIVNIFPDFSHLWAEKRKYCPLFVVWHIDKALSFPLQYPQKDRKRLHFPPMPLSALLLHIGGPFL